jgi:hypothetical protein
MEKKLFNETIKVYTPVFFAKSITPIESKLLTLIINKTENNEMFCYSTQLLGDMFGVTRQTVNYSLKNLVKLNLIGYKEKPVLTTSIKIQKVYYANLEVIKTFLKNELTLNGIQFFN